MADPRESGHYVIGKGFPHEVGRLGFGRSSGIGGEPIGIHMPDIELTTEAFEYVRITRAGEAVGTVLYPDGTHAPYIGIEPYHLTIKPEEMKPKDIEEIIAKEVSLGRKIMLAMDHAESLGFRLSKTELKNWLMKKDKPEIPPIDILVFFEPLWGEIIATARAAGSPEATAPFQEETYRRIANKDNLPREPLPHTTVLKPEDVEPYKVLSQMYYFGKPEVRKAADKSK